jgi:lipid II:glycine glycyltransferase (peptidoglycan interpeptide bridge formation enzyme)
MQTVIVDGKDVGEWDAFIVGVDRFSMMQSSKWGDVKEKLGWKVHRVAVAEGGAIVAAAQLLIKRLPLGVGSLAYVPRGPVGAWEDPAVAALLFDALHSIARNNHAVMLKVEPAALDGPEVRDVLSSAGFQPSTYSNQPSALVILDITGDAETILGDMRDSTRRHIRTAERKGVSVRRGGAGDLGTFYSLMQATAKRSGFTLRSRTYYETEFQAFDEDGRAGMFLADFEGRTIGAHIAYAFGAHAAQFHLASSNGTTVSPNHLLVWEQIKWAQARGCRTLDLGGIPDEIGALVAKGEDLPVDRVDGLWGVYRFKRGFSRDIVTYAGSFDYVYAPGRYAVISRWLAGGRVLERISSLMDARPRR